VYIKWFLNENYNYKVFRKLFFNKIYELTLGLEKFIDVFWSLEVERNKSLSSAKFV
jgi:hypothetical protein